MAAIFRPTANMWAKAVLLAAAGLLVGGSGWWWMWPRTDWARRDGFAVPLPVPFSHQHHVAGLGIGCLMCHSKVEAGASAGLPPTYTCMTCHSQVWTNAEVLAPVRASMADDRPMSWGRVHDLPDYVYFNHSIHVAKGVGCSTCHGAVETMQLMRKVETMTMGWCLDCHRNPGPNLRPASEIYNGAWHRGAGTPPPEALVAQYGIGGRNLTECSICHR